MPPKSASIIQPTSSPPQLSQIYSAKERRSAGVGMNYVDMYNDSQLAQYNNEYNYWLWQQQADYNSPVNQVARAKEAGLNPNVVAGNVSSGNLQSTPESKANYRSNIMGNKMQVFNAGINAFNSMLNAVKDGVSAVSQISGIPDDISTYRHLLTRNLQLGTDNKALQKILSTLEANQRAYGLFSPEYYDTLTPDNPLYDYLVDPKQSGIYDGYTLSQQRLRNQSMRLLNQLRSYDFENIKPAQLDKINAEIDKIGKAANLTQEQVDMYKISSGTDVASKILGLLMKAVL